VAALVVVAASDSIRSAGDAFWALGKCLLAQVVGCLIAGGIVEYLRRPNVSSLDAAAKRSRGWSVMVARVAFWLSMVLLLLLSLAAVYVLMVSFAQLS
jgi:hypothetical protein